MSVNYNYYQIFYFVAENQNITAAADQLFLSQSTVSRSIQALEHELNTTLMIRSKQGISLTKEGEYLHGIVKSVYAQLTAAENHFRDISNLNGTSLRIGATEFTFKQFLMPYIVSLQKEYPDMHLNMNTFLPVSQQIELLKSGILDLCILTTPFQKDRELIIEPLTSYQSVLIAPPDRKDLTAGTFLITQLSDEPFIGWEDSSSGQKYMAEITKTYDFHVTPKYIVCSAAAVRESVANGLGLGIVPLATAQKDIADGTVLSVPLEKPLPRRQICAVYAEAFAYNPPRDYFIKKLLS